MTVAPDARAAQLDASYRSTRLRLRSLVAAQVAAGWAQRRTDRTAAVQNAIRVVEAGQAQTVRLLEAYMAAKALHETGEFVRVGLDPADYTTAALRKLPSISVYSRPFGAFGAKLNAGGSLDDALTSALASVTKLATTDLQLAQTHAARDWMDRSSEYLTGELRIVGYRRVLTGPGPHCALCEAASTRTYRVSDLLPIHEHCGCTVEPLYGTEPVASVGTTVRVDIDPELGPRLMADDWTPIGPRLVP